MTISEQDLTLLEGTTEKLSWKIEQAMWLDHAVRIGLTEQAWKEDLAIEQGSQNERVDLYGPPEHLEVRLRSVNEANEVSSLMKRGSWTGPPSVVQLDLSHEGPSLASLVNKSHEEGHEER